MSEQTDQQLKPTKKELTLINALLRASTSYVEKFGIHRLLPKAEWKAFSPSAVTSLGGVARWRTVGIHGR